MHRSDESLGQQESAGGGRSSPAVHQVRMPASAEKLTETRRVLAAWAHRQGFPGDLVQSIQLACYEAMANVAEHAYAGGDGELVLRAIALPTRLDVTVTDNGLWREERDDSSGGLGLPLIRRLADHAEIETGDRGTVVSMTWFLPGNL